MSAERAVECIKQNRDVCVGVKALLSRAISDEGRLEEATFAMALDASAACGVPLMTHHSDSAIDIDGCPGRLRQGDIYTHW